MIRTPTQQRAWSPRLLLGKLAHRAIELDHAGGFTRPVKDLVTHAWMEAASDRGSAATFVADLTRVAADGLKGAVTERVITFRESFPVLPPSAEVRAEKPYTVRLAGGAVGFDHLEAAARTVAAKVERAGLLIGAPPPVDQLRLVPAAACGWRARAPGCPAAAVAADDTAVTSS